MNYDLTKRGQLRWFHRAMLCQQSWGSRDCEWVNSESCSRVTSSHLIPLLQPARPKRARENRTILLSQFESLIPGWKLNSDFLLRNSSLGAVSSSGGLLTRRQLTIFSPIYSTLPYFENFPHYLEHVQKPQKRFSTKKLTYIWTYSNYYAILTLNLNLKLEVSNV